MNNKFKKTSFTHCNIAFKVDFELISSSKTFSNKFFLTYLRMKQSEVVVQSCSIKTFHLTLLQILQENICPRSSFLVRLQAAALQFYYKQAAALQFYYKETREHLLSCLFCKIYKNIFFTEKDDYFRRLDLKKQLFCNRSKHLICMVCIT